MYLSSWPSSLPHLNAKANQLTGDTEVVVHAGDNMYVSKKTCYSCFCFILIFPFQSFAKLLSQIVSHEFSNMFDAVTTDGVLVLYVFISLLFEYLLLLHFCSYRARIYWVCLFIDLQKTSKCILRAKIYINVIYFMNDTILLA